ncbi:GNAT family N-acetyltransferase [Listeria grandensis]|uniref:GNAT family N-acetyltransferase n=1 Tax=Listeria grandensis TaxID=1494963 RepID=UPI00164CF8BF|nr:GNAT family N-acetyltransferase [Listeria grandensis]MBC6314341.1 GNAT family N-acetyltransferase [Listeria grandensis]
MTTNKNNIPLGDDIFVVKEASVSEEASLQQLMIDTASWLKSRGSSQWSDILEGMDVHGLSDRIRDGEVFLVLRGAEITAAFILRKTASDWDARLWNDHGKDAPARYLHRLMIAREWSGKNLSQAILDWASKEAEHTGHVAVRLDCIADNQKLNTLYQNAGFINIATVDGFCIYEKKRRN